MFTRFILTFLFSLISGAQASACSCAPWEGGNVSDLYAGKTYISVWVIPTNGTVKEQDSEWDRFFVSYDLKVMESFNQTSAKQITAISSIQDGASCGLQLDLGNPHFLTLARTTDGNYLISTCNPELPYQEVKAFLKTGKDSYIPGIYECRKKNDEIRTDKGCHVWKDMPYFGRSGDEDTHGYRLRFNAETKISAEPKKKRRWWSFKKD